MGIYRTVGNHVKITYLHTLHDFALDVSAVNYYDCVDSSTKTTASPAVGRLRADPAHTNNREPCPNVAGPSARPCLGANRIARCAPTPGKRGPCA